MAIGLSTAWGFFMDTLWPLIKELLFGKYRLADYFRERKIVLLLLFFFVLMTVMFINMTENALVSNQHIRYITDEHNKKVATLENDLLKQTELTQGYRNRLALSCIGSESYFCREPDLSIIQPIRTEEETISLADGNE